MWVPALSPPPFHPALRMGCVPAPATLTGGGRRCLEMALAASPAQLHIRRASLHTPPQVDPTRRLAFARLNSMLPVHARRPLLPAAALVLRRASRLLLRSWAVLSTRPVRRPFSSTRERASSQPIGSPEQSTPTRSGNPSGCPGRAGRPVRAGASEPPLAGGVIEFEPPYDAAHDARNRPAAARLEEAQQCIEATPPCGPATA